MYKLFTIPQGKHSSGFHFRPHIGRKSLQYDIMFDSGAKYYHGDIDQYDINKLFGLSFGHHHTNSVRFGWRSLGNLTTSVEILSYCYLNGNRVNEDGQNLFISMVDIGRYYTYRIDISDKFYTLTILDDKKVIGQKIVYHKPIPCWGYQLYPYFGGNKKAPHDIKILFKR